jgi:hypothetical protein
MKKIQHELWWGVYFTLMMIGWMDFEKIVGFHDKHIELHPIVTNIVMIPAVAMYVLAIQKKRIQLGGKITYKQAFMSGGLMTLCITLLTPLTIYISVVLISPSFFENMIQHAVSTGQATQAEATAYFNLKSYLIQSVMATPFMGLITTTIVAFFSSRK